MEEHVVMGASSRSRITLRDLGIGLAVFLLCAILAYVRVSRSPDEPGGDFWQHWAAARALLAHSDPYASVTPATLRDPSRPETAFENWYYYPIPAALLGLPFAWANVNVAAALFSGAAAVLFWVIVVRPVPERVGVLFSSPFIFAVFSAQSTPLLVAAACVPVMQGLLAIKPNVGLALEVWKPSVLGVVGAVFILGASVVAYPHWPREWLLAVARSPHHHPPIGLAYGGPILLLFLLRWRRPEARLGIALSLVPQILLFYDQLPLVLALTTKREVRVFTWCSWIAYVAWLATSINRSQGIIDVRRAAPWVLALIYLPVLLIVLRRPNEGVLPASAQRAIATFEKRLRRGRHGASSV